MPVKIGGMEPGPQSASAMQADKRALDQLGLALRNVTPNSLLRPFLGLVICLLFAHWVTAPMLTAWFVIVALGALPLFLTTRLFAKLAPQPEEARRWIAASTGAYLAFALSWSTMGYFLWVPGNDLDHLVILLLLACTVAGNSALVGASVSLCLVSLLTYGTALVVTPLLGGALYGGLTFLSLPFLAYIVFMSRQVHRTSCNMLALQEEKDQLIAKLASAKVQAEAGREQAMAANLAKSHFLANLGHDLRTPLNAILGFSEMIFTRTFKDPEKHYEYAELIHGSGQSLLTLINDILDLAKLEAGRFQMREGDIDLGCVIEDAIRAVQPKADAAGCVLTMEIDPNLPLVFADERALRQIMLNLLSNAVKFSPNGCAMAFASGAADGSIHFGVADTGIGMSPADQARLSQSLGGGPDEVTKHAKGAGLGLPIVHGLVAIHGGSVMLDSTEGEGTRVTAILPSDRARAPRQAVRPSAA